MSKVNFFGSLVGSVPQSRTSNNYLQGYVPNVPVYVYNFFFFLNSVHSLAHIRIQCKYRNETSKYLLLLLTYLGTSQDRHSSSLDT